MDFLQEIKIGSEIEKFINKPLDIKEILMRDTDINVVVDAYGFFMRKYQWDIDNCHDPVIKNLLLAFSFDGEIQNGGFYQFFYNSSGKYTYLTVDALHTIGAFDAEKLLKEAVALFPDGNVPEDDDLRSQILDQITDEDVDFSELDSEYDVDILLMCYRYLMENKEHLIG